MSYEVDPKLVECFDPPIFEEFKNIFKEFDKNNNGLMEKSEFIALLADLGYKNVTNQDADELFKSVDLNSDSVLQFSEFLGIMKQIKSKDDSNVQLDQFTTKTGKAMVKVAKKDSIQFQTFSEEERAAYVKVINSSLANDSLCKKYLPINPDTNELFDKLKDGVLLCKLVNKAQEGTIDERVINTKEKLNIYQQAENLSLAISASKSIGLNCIGINYDILFMELII